MSDDRRGSISRRVFARLTMWGAVGASFTGLTGCNRARATCYVQANLTKVSSALAGWSDLGRVWREMSRHLRGDADDLTVEAFAELRREMDAALDAVGASPELRAVFTERWEHIDRIQYNMATCYEMVMGGIPVAREKVEEQVAELEKLVADGTLTENAGRKAAEALGVHVEYMARLHEVDGEDYEAQAEVTRPYDDGEMQPGEEANTASERIVEMTVDKLEWLAAPVPRGEEADE